VDRHELGNSFIWEAVPSCSTSLLHYPNSPFDLGYVLIGTCQIDHGATWHRLNQRLERSTFAVGVHHLDVEIMLEIILIHLFESLEYLQYRAIREMIDCREADFMTEFQEERNIFDKEDVGCLKHLLLKLHYLHGYSQPPESTCSKWSCLLALRCSCPKSSEPHRYLGPSRDNP
jgi:hypothetical protein